MEHIWVARHNTALAGFDEIDEFTDILIGFSVHNFAQSVAAVQSGVEIYAYSVPYSGTIGAGYIIAPHSDDVCAAHISAFSEQTVWGNILHNIGSGGHHCHFADAAELVNQDISAQNCAEPDFDVSGYAGTVGYCDMVGNAAVVSDMYEGHQEHMITDNGFTVFKRRAVNCDIFPDNGIGSDLSTWGYPD